MTVATRGENGPGPLVQAGQLVFILLYGIALLAAANWLLSNVSQVKPAQRAVVMRLGVLHRVQTAGLLLAFPAPLEQVVTVPSAESILERHVEALLRQVGDLPFGATLAGQFGDANAGSGYLLTGDAGVVQLDVRVFYRVVDPFEYVMQGTHVLPALDRLVTRSAAVVCAARDLDTILVARPEVAGDGNESAASREQLRNDLLREINFALADLRSRGAGLGIELVRIDVQSSLPDSAVSAFNAVLTASQYAETEAAAARNEAALVTQAATEAVDRALQAARAQASERLAMAQADTSTVAGLSKSVRDGIEPEILLRIYRERMPTILEQAGSVTAVNPRDDARLIIRGAE